MRAIRRYREGLQRRLLELLDWNNCRLQAWPGLAAAWSLDLRFSFQHRQRLFQISKLEGFL